MCAPVINRQIGFAGWARVGARSAGLYLTCTRVHLRSTTYVHLYKRRYEARLAELDELSSLLSSPLFWARRGRQTTNRAISPLHGPRPLKCLETVVSNLCRERVGRGGETLSLSLSLDSLFRVRGTVSDETLIAVSLDSRVVLGSIFRRIADRESNRNS